ncbi:hypothetical protein M1466_02480 [Candidatus Dependentiae bacterium]|nr:hypothetical protein [Candidatus Dependentiae bacterium]
MNYRIFLLLIIAWLLVPSLHGMASTDNQFSTIDPLLLSAVAHAQEKEKSATALLLLFEENADKTGGLRFIFNRFLYLWACPEERNAELMQQLPSSAIESDNNWATICTALLAQQIPLQRLVSHNGRKKIVSAYLLSLLLNRADIFCFLAQYAYNQNLTVDTTEMSGRGYSLLHFAILLGNRDAIALLQLLRADFEQRTGDTTNLLHADRTPLELATIAGNQEIIAVVTHCLQEQQEECAREQAIAQVKEDLHRIFAQREMVANAAPEEQPAEPTITHPGSDELSSVTEASAQQQLPRIQLGGRSTAYLATLATTDDLAELDDDVNNPYLGRPLKSPRLRRSAPIQPAALLPVAQAVPAREELISDADTIPTVPSHEVVEPIVPVTKPHNHCCAIL